MPIYEYRCRACGATFEELRPASAADAPVACTCTAADTVRLPSLVARSGVGRELPLAAGPSGPGAGGGCCGGACGC